MAKHQMPETPSATAADAHISILSLTQAMVLVAVVALAGCKGGDSPETGTPLTKRQADSAIGASGLPGAGGVTRAITAADSAAARNARLDSAAVEP